MEEFQAAVEELVQKREKGTRKFLSTMSSLREKAGIADKEDDAEGNVAEKDDTAEKGVPVSERDDDLEGRKIISLNRGRNRTNNAPLCQFAVTDTISVGAKKQLRNSNDPNGGSFMVINFRRVSKEFKGPVYGGGGGNARTSKPYDFNLYEDLTCQLLEILVFFIGSCVFAPFECLPLDKVRRNDEGVYDITGLETVR